LDVSELARQYGIEEHDALVLASVGQGQELLTNIESLEIPVNEPFERLVVAPRSLDLLGTSITVLGPLQERLDPLRQQWADATTKGDVTKLAGLFRDDLDEGIPNLSSISLLVEVNRRKILLTGNPRGDDIVAGWEAAGNDPDVPVPIDILKMPHHGSDRNLTKDFLELFPADHYVISANGKFGNPDLGTVKAMTESLGNREYTIHITNHTPEGNGGVPHESGGKAGAQVQGEVPRG
jgi:hypothetical protein